MIDWTPVVAALATGISALFTVLVGYIAIRTGQIHTMVNSQHDTMVSDAREKDARIQALEHPVLPVVPPGPPTP